MTIIRKENTRGYFSNRNIRWDVLASVIAPAALAGCSLSYVDDEGSKHVFGLGYVKVNAADIAFDNGAALTEVTSFGLALYSNNHSSGLTLGYNRESVVSLEGNACVATTLEPLWPFTPAFNYRQEDKIGGAGHE